MSGKIHPDDKLELALLLPLKVYPLDFEKIADVLFVALEANFPCTCSTYWKSKHHGARRQVSHQAFCKSHNREKAVAVFAMGYLAGGARR